ncbi:MAG: threonylcarbamoyl-AMP synthase [Bacteroidales bacterium]|nr:threonylcarbamoyl-AMP synthase [Bacteroidales bacterium]
MKEAEVLREGKILIYPTDTIWGIGCDALNVSAIEKVKKIKGRDNTKSFILLMRDLDMLKNYVEKIPNEAIKLMQDINEPLTIIYPKAKNLPIEHLSFNQSIGVRIPKDDFLQTLFEEFPYPIVSSSANFSGQDSPKTFSDIDKNFLEQADYISKRQAEKNETRHSSLLYLISESGEIIQLR